MYQGRWFHPGVVHVRGKIDKLTLETVPVAGDTNTILMLKPGYETSVTLYSTDNCSNSAVSLSLSLQIKLEMKLYLYLWKIQPILLEKGL